MDKLRLVFDFDDVLWDLNARTTRMAQVPYDKLVTFYPADNPLLTDDERARLMAIYPTDEPFDNIGFLHGAGLFGKLADYPALDLWICSNCLSETVRDKKDAALRELYGPCLARFTTWYNIVSMGDSREKTLPPDIWCIVDDNPLNIKAAHAKKALLPRRPWNQSQWGREILREAEQDGCRIEFYNTLTEAFVKILAAVNADLFE